MTRSTLTTRTGLLVTLKLYTNDGVSTVYLHGNKIAEVVDDFMTNFRWWLAIQYHKIPSECTDDLNSAMLTDGVFQKDFLWYVRKFVQSTDKMSTRLKTSFLVTSSPDPAENTQQKTLQTSTQTK